MAATSKPSARARSGATSAAAAATAAPAAAASCEACATGAADGHHGYSQDKDKLLQRLARIEGQVRGIAGMVEGDRYCIDILTQIGAVETALEAVGLKILEDHVRHCVAGAMASGDPEAAAEKSRELLEAVQRFVKTR